MGLYQKFIGNTRKPDGLLGKLMVAGMNSDHTAVKFAKIIDGMNLYTPGQLKKLLENAGFGEIEQHQAADKPWIAVVGRKSM